MVRDATINLLRFHSGAYRSRALVAYRDIFFHGLKPFRMGFLRFLFPGKLGGATIFA